MKIIPTGATEIEIVPTDVPDTAAAHFDLAAANGTTQQLTVVWSTRDRRCDPTDLIGEHAVVHLRADRPPRLWDTTGCGQWQVASYTQCGCGQLVFPRVDLHDGHLHGAALTSAARSVAADARADDEADLATIREWLTDLIDGDLADIRAGYRTLDDFRPSWQTGPGEVGIDDHGRLTAWTYDPVSSGDCDVVEVTRAVTEEEDHQ